MIEMHQLHQLQDLDVQIEAKLAELEEIQAALGETSALTEARDRVEHLRSLLHEQEQRLRELEWDAEKLQHHVTEDEAKLYGGKVRAPKELSDLQRDVTQYRAQLGKVEDRELELMADVESTQADLQRAQDDLARVRAAWEEGQRTLSGRQTEADAALADLRGARGKLVTSVASPILAEYERLRREKHGRAVSKIERSNCQGCRIALPMGIVSRVRAGRELVLSHNKEARCHMAESLVGLTREGKTAWLTLRRPDKLNALSPELLGQAQEILERVAADAEIACLIVRGEGRAFCAGADLASMRELTPVQAHRRFAGGGFWSALEALPQPTIAAIHGYCFGGGCELALACDFRLVADNAQFGQPEIKVGLIPGAGGTQRLPRLIGMTKAKEMVMLGEPIDAQEAYRVGLVNRVVSLDALADEARRWADQLAQLPPLSVRMAKSVMNQGRDLDLPAALEIERLGFSLLFSTEDRQEGVRAFLEKRPASYQGR